MFRERRHVAPVLASMMVLLMLSGCGGSKPETPYFVASHEDWRDNRERACLKSKRVRETSYISRMKKLNGPSVCGARRPFKVAALGGGTVAMSTPATLRCSMIPALDRWIASSVQPQARAAFGDVAFDHVAVLDKRQRPAQMGLGGHM